MDAALTRNDLDQVLEHELLGSLMSKGEPVLGLEVEHLVLHRDTRRNAPLEFCRQLMERIAGETSGRRVYDGEVLRQIDGDRLFWTMEPGGQLELATVPTRNLHELEPIMAKGVALVRGLLEQTPYDLVSLGHAPVTPVAELGLLPRDRYRIMDAAMPERGQLVRNMMRATAGLQITYDVRNREEVGQKLALLNRLSPVLAAMTANSREVEGRDSGYASYRHEVWLHTDTDRSGVPPGTLHPETAIDGYKRFAMQATTLFFKRDDKVVEAPHRPFGDLVDEGVATHDDLALHLSSLFPFVRLRNYLEVRCMDAVEWPLARAVLALLAGIVYCPAATANAFALSERLIIEDPAELRAFHHQVALRGLDCETPDGRPFRSVVGDLLDCSRTTLGGPDCGWAGRGDLAALEARLG